MNLFIGFAAVVGVLIIVFSLIYILSIISGKSVEKYQRSVKGENCPNHLRRGENSDEGQSGEYSIQETVLELDSLAENITSYLALSQGLISQASPCADPECKQAHFEYMDACNSTCRKIVKNLEKFRQIFSNQLEKPDFKTWFIAAREKSPEEQAFIQFEKRILTYQGPNTRERQAHKHGWVFSRNFSLAKENGPGTLGGRFQSLMEKLRLRWHDSQEHSAEPPEERFIEWLDILIKEHATLSQSSSTSIARVGEEKISSIGQTELCNKTLCIGAVVNENQESEKVISKNNSTWDLLVREFEPYLNRNYIDKYGKVFTFFGLIYGIDDYYYGLIGRDGILLQLSAVGTIEGYGFTLLSTLHPYIEPASCSWKTEVLIPEGCILGGLGTKDPMTFECPSSTCCRHAEDQNAPAAIVRDGRIAWISEAAKRATSGNYLYRQENLSDIHARLRHMLDHLPSSTEVNARWVEAHCLAILENRNFPPLTISNTP